MRVVSWNIHWACGRDGRVRVPAVIDVLRKLNPDVICLQEVAANHPELEGNVSADQHRQLAGAFGGYQAIYAPTSEIYKNNMPRLFGNLLLSKYRITQALRHSLPWPADPAHGAGMPRGLIEVVIDAPRGPVRVLTTHLEYYSALQRMAQVRQIRHLHHEACERARYDEPDASLDAPFQFGLWPASAIVCGDFNMAPESPEYRTMLAPGEGQALSLVDAWRQQHPGVSHAPTAGLHGFKWPEKPGCFDYAFVTEDLAPKLTDMHIQSETSVSDHQPLVLDMEK